MLLDFKMVFLRESEIFNLKDLPTYISNFLSYLRYNPTLFVVNLALNLKKSLYDELIRLEIEPAKIVNDLVEKYIKELKKTEI